MRALFATVVALMLPARALAGELVVELQSPQAERITQAVAWFKPAAGTPSPARPTGVYQMVQRDIRFEPGVLVVPVGAEVSFPNRDKVRHHVFSFSAAKRFELKLYGRDETRKITFDFPGVISLGCNIHDQMAGFIVVLDTPYAAKVDENGRIVLQNLPPGPGTLTIWHPLQRSPNGEVSEQVTVPASGAARVSLALRLRPPPEGKAAFF